MDEQCNDQDRHGSYAVFFEKSKSVKNFKEAHDVLLELLKTAQDDNDKSETWRLAAYDLISDCVYLDPMRIHKSNRQASNWGHMISMRFLGCFDVTKFSEKQQTSLNAILDDISNWKIHRPFDGKWFDIKFNNADALMARAIGHKQVIDLLELTLTLGCCSKEVIEKALKRSATSNKGKLVKFVKDHNLSDLLPSAYRV